MAKKNPYDSDLGTGSSSGSTAYGSGTSSYDEDSRSEALKQRFAGIGDSTASQIDNSPLIALGAGLALGAVLGAVLPISSREREVLEPLGKRLNEKGTDAIDRSRTMAKQKFDEMAGDKVREFLGGGSGSSSSSSSSGSSANA